MSSKFNHFTQQNTEDTGKKTTTAVLTEFSSVESKVKFEFTYLIF